MGGYNSGTLSSVERYNPAENAWQAVAPMATARYAHAVAVLDGKLYAVGRYDDGFLSSVERYDPAAGAWEAVAPLAEARRVLAVAVLDGKLYAVGGLSTGHNRLSSVGVAVPPARPSGAARGRRGRTSRAQSRARTCRATGPMARPCLHTESAGPPARRPMESGVSGSLKGQRRRGKENARNIRALVSSRPGSWLCS